VDEGEYELVAGERRWRAARRAGLQTIPALIRTVGDTATLEQALVENLQREDLNPLDEASAYQQLIEDFHLTHDEVATRVGRSRVAISNTLRLFQLPSGIQKLVAEGQLAAGHARALLGTPDRSFQEALARRAVAEGLSVRAVEEAVRKHGEQGPERARATQAARRLRAPGLLELEELLSGHLDTRVRVEMGTGQGRVVVEFATLEDLERIYRAMTQASIARPMARAREAPWTTRAPGGPSSHTTAGMRVSRRTGSAIPSAVRPPSGSTVPSSCTRASARRRPPGDSKPCAP
jgi:ParB family chromosome partitioning protein